MADVLLDALAYALRWRIWVALEELFRRAIETKERRRVDTVSEVSANRPNGRTIADAEANRMRRVVEILQIALVKAERNIAQGAEDIAHIMEKDPLNVRPEKRKPQLDIIEEESVSAEGKSGWL